MRKTALVLPILLAGCATGPDRQSYAAAWIGQPLDAFAVRHGLPKAQQPMADGRSLVEWKDVHGLGRGGVFTDAIVGSMGGAETQGGSYQLTCEVRMVVDKSGRIADFAVVKDTIGAWQPSRCAEVLP